MHTNNPTAADGEMNTKANLNVDQIKLSFVPADHHTSDVQSWITQAKTDHDWVILVYHDITTTLQATKNQHMRLLQLSLNSGWSI